MLVFSKRKQLGFTLIELIIVIVILGILAVVAAPRFIDISSESKVSGLQALKGALVSSNQIIYGKALIQGLTDQASANVQLSPNESVAIQYGYLSYDGSSASSGAFQLTDAVNFTICHHLADDAACADADWRFDIDSDHIQFYFASAGQDPANGGGEAGEPLCYLKYTMASDADTLPVYELQTADC
jgi:prepilin-type N-terminal cleavage/methylation domain-containing protein